MPEDDEVAGDVAVALADDGVAVVELRRPPANYFDVALIDALADALEGLDEDPACRAVVLCSQGRHFCAGADLTQPSLGVGAGEDWGAADLYRAGARLVACATPVVVAVQGAAVGGGLGLACVGDLRVATPTSRFAANFSRLGFHHGFGLTATLPRIVGPTRACELLYTGRSVPGEEALELGLCDRLAAVGEEREAAGELARSIAAAAPLAVRSIRATMRTGLLEQFREATRREHAEQDRLRRTRDFHEGVAASAERREPRFEGR